MHPLAKWTQPAASQALKTPRDSERPEMGWLYEGEELHVQADGGGEGLTTTWEPKRGATSGHLQEFWAPQGLRGVMSFKVLGQRMRWGEHTLVLWLKLVSNSSC